MTKNTTDFARNVTSFLTDFLPFQRNYSSNTISSYKDALKLFARFISEEKGVNLKAFCMKDFNKDVIIEFLKFIRKRCSILSTNQRLAALKSFASYCMIDSIENIAFLQDIGQIKCAKTKGKIIEFLSREQVQALINAPDSHTRNGLRHRVVLCILYDSGARVQEVCDMTIRDVQFGHPSTIHLSGKCNKTRIVPISEELASLIGIYMEKVIGNKPLLDSWLITNKNGLKMSRDGIEYITNKYANMVRGYGEVIMPEKVHPHQLRHSKASHMLAAGVPIVYIRDFLGLPRIPGNPSYPHYLVTRKLDCISFI
jgi:integrase/recombinase XerD